MSKTRTLPGSLPPTPRVCVVGAGYWGKNLIRNFGEIGSLGAVCDVNRRALEDFSLRYPHIRIYDSLAQVLGDDSIDAVAIATPAEQHHSMVMAALREGRHVFVEKPLALDSEDGIEMVEAAEKRDLVLMVGHLLRYHPAILKIKELIDAGTLG